MFQDSKLHHARIKLSNKQFLKTVKILDINKNKTNKKQKKY